MSTLQIERRFHAGEIRAADDDAREIRGYAAVFNSPAEIGSMFTEVILPGAFDDVLEDDVRGLFNHDANFVLGRTAAGTMRLFVDERGLGYSITPPDAQWANDLLVSIRRGDVSQSSFAFIVKEEAWREEKLPDGGYHVTREIVKLERLFDVSPVTYPAYADTTVSARTIEQYRAVITPAGGPAEAARKARLLTSTYR